MNGSTRIIINTGVQYIRSIITIVVTLYTSRVVLENLGVDDFGIYSLVGGVITMLAFIQNSLSRTTQRYLNYYQGRKDSIMIERVFNNSIICQLFVSCVLCILLLSIIDPIFHYILNIDYHRISEAKLVYIFMTFSLFFNLQSAPYLAALIARENIIYSSLVQILDAILKIPIAVSLFYILNDRLTWYAGMICSLSILNFVLYYVYTKKYPECQNFKFKSFDIKLIKRMFSFTVWTTYGAFSIVGRTQGIAILLNRFYSTAINSAYGIGTQVIGQLNFFSAAIFTAINPQMIKAEGSGNRVKAINLAEISSKFSTLMLSMILVPAFFYIDFLLAIWLKKVPEYTAMFCRYIIVITLLDLMTLGLNYLNGAIGNVKLYSIIIYSVALMTLPFGYLALKFGYGAIGVMHVYVIFTIITGIVRLWFLNHDINLSIGSFFKNVILPVFMIIGINCIVCYYLTAVFTNWMLLLTGIVSCLVTCILTFSFGLQPNERIIASMIFSKLKNKFTNAHK